MTTRPEYRQYRCPDLQMQATDNRTSSSGRFIKAETVPDPNPETAQKTMVQTGNPGMTKRPALPLPLPPISRYGAVNTSRLACIRTLGKRVCNPQIPQKMRRRIAEPRAPVNGFPSTLKEAPDQDPGQECCGGKINPGIFPGKDNLLQHPVLRYGLVIRLQVLAYNSR